MPNGLFGTGDLRVDLLTKSGSGKQLVKILMPKQTISLKKLAPASKDYKGTQTWTDQVSAKLKNEFLIKYSTPFNILNFSLTKQRSSQCKATLTEQPYLKAKIAGIKSRKPSTLGPVNKTPVFFCADKASADYLHTTPIMS